MKGKKCSEFFEGETINNIIKIGAISMSFHPLMIPVTTASVVTKTQEGKRRRMSVMA